MTAVSISPELVMLLRGADTGPPPVDVPPALVRSVDATARARLVDAAIVQGLGPWLCRTLDRTAGLDDLPADAARRLHESALGVAARNLVLCDELAGILRAAAAADVRCAPVRGPALAERLYGDVSVRPSGDLDLIVERQALPRLVAVLESLGFRELSHRPGFAGAFSYALSFVRDRHGWIVVEPHWTITYPPYVDGVDMDAVWRRCRLTRIVGAPAWALAPEDLLFHLCLHLLHPDGGAPLLWHYEVHRLVVLAGDDLDWPLFLSLAREPALLALVAEALSVVQSLFATPLPPGAAAALAAARTAARGRRIVELLADGERGDGREELATLMSLPTARLRARYVLGLLFPSRQFMTAQHGLTRRGQLPLAYLARCGRLGWRGARAISRLVF